MKLKDLVLNMILDKLMEKKDLMIYIDLRIQHLKKVYEKQFLGFSPKIRSKVAERHKGRIKELNKLKSVIIGTKLKEIDKRYWKNAALSEENK